MIGLETLATSMLMYSVIASPGPITSPVSTGIRASPPAPAISAKLSSGSEASCSRIA